MYSQEQIQELQELSNRAGEKMDEIRGTLERLYDLEATRSTDLRAELLNWQSWLGAIAFTLSGISGAALVTGNQSNGFAVAASITFFAAGAWIAIFKKYQAEKALTIKSMYPAFMREYDKQKKSAFDAHQNPTLVNKSQLEIHKAQINIMNLSINYSQSRINELRTGKISYENDYWIFMLFLGIYLLLVPSLWSIYQPFSANPVQFWIVVVSIPVIVALIIVWQANLTKKAILEYYAELIIDQKYEIEKVNEYLEHLKKACAKLQELEKSQK